MKVTENLFYPIIWHCYIKDIKSYRKCKIYFNRKLGKEGRDEVLLTRRIKLYTIFADGFFYHVLCHIPLISLRRKMPYQLSRRIKFPKMSAFISFEKSNVRWGLSRWEQLREDKNALVGFHFITENKSDTFKQTIRFSYMHAKLSLARSFWEKWSTCLPTCTSIHTTPRVY